VVLDERRHERVTRVRGDDEADERDADPLQRVRARLAAVEPGAHASEPTLVGVILVHGGLPEAEVWQVDGAPS
jgi:hypothetical protein